MKTCCRCKLEKELFEFRKDKRSRDGCGGHCKACAKAEWHVYYAKAKDDQSLTRNQPLKRKEWNARRDPEKQKEHRKNQYKKMTEQQKTMKRDYLRRWSLALNDSAVRKLIANRTGTKPGDIPDSLIEAERIRIQIKRFAKDMM